MAKAKKKVLPPPYLAAAFLCEKVLVENDRVPSYMRVVDQFTLPRPVTENPHGAVIALSNNMLVVSFKDGGFKGKLPLKIEREGPSGARVTFIEHMMEFDGSVPGGGNSLAIYVHIPWDGEGLYWFDVSLGGVLRTRIAAHISLAKPSSSGSPKKSAKKPKI